MTRLLGTDLLLQFMQAPLIVGSYGALQFRAQMVQVAHQHLLSSHPFRKSTLQCFVRERSPGKRSICSTVFACATSL